jgi:glycine/sarcosine N-methyltransferase
MAVSSIEFYRALARRYDELFPEDPVVTDFLASGLPPGARVLDLACGTGTYAAALAARGFSVMGLDLSEDLVAIGRSRGRAAPLAVADMRSFRSTAPGPFERICCIGNSLPHLRDEAEVAALLSDARAALAPAGSLVVQTINFDRGPELTSLPPLRAGAVAMERRYLWADGRLTFVATLSEPGSPPRSGSVQLLPLASGRLASLASAAGFGAVSVAGGFGAKPHTRESFVTVLVARA